MFWKPDPFPSSGKAAPKLVNHSDWAILTQGPYSQLLKIYTWEHI